MVTYFHDKFNHPDGTRITSYDPIIGLRWTEPGDSGTKQGQTFDDVATGWDIPTNLDVYGLIPTHAAYTTTVTTFTAKLYTALGIAVDAAATAGYGWTFAQDSVETTILAGVSVWTYIDEFGASFAALRLELFTGSTVESGAVIDGVQGSFVGYSPGGTDDIVITCTGTTVTAASAMLGTVSLTRSTMGPYLAGLGIENFSREWAGLPNLLGWYWSEILQNIEGQVGPCDLTIDPPTVTLSPGGAQIFVASDPSSYEVVEAGGGTIDSSGNYTAPLTPGTYHVKAVRA